MKEFIPGDLCQIPALPVLYTYKEVLTAKEEEVAWDMQIGEVKPGDIVFVTKKLYRKDAKANFYQIITKVGLRWIHCYDVKEYKEKSG